MNICSAKGGDREMNKFGTYRRGSGLSFCLAYIHKLVMFLPYECKNQEA